MTSGYMTVRIIPMASFQSALGVAALTLYAFYLGWWARRIWARGGRWSPVCKAMHAGAVALDVLGILWCCLAM